MIFLNRCNVLLQSNRVYDAARSFKWYYLPQSEMQNYQILLHSAQQPQILYIAGVFPLNMETCVSVGVGLTEREERKNCDIRFYVTMCLLHFSDLEGDLFLCHVIEFEYKCILR